MAKWGITVFDPSFEPPKAYEWFNCTEVSFTNGHLCFKSEDGEFHRTNLKFAARKEVKSVEKEGE